MKQDSFTFRRIFKDDWMDYLIKPEKTDAEARAFVIFVRDTYRIKGSMLLFKVVDRDKTLVLKSLDEKTEMSAPRLT